jgi:hypothetical protein
LNENSINQVPGSKNPSGIFQSPQTLAILRSIGYGLLILALFDLVAMVIPFRFMNPLWEFQRFGELVERITVPLIAMGMIFSGENNWRKPLERAVVSLLSWLCLLFAILLILLIPVAMSNVQRINAQTGAELGAQFSQQRDRADQLQSEISQINGDELQQFLESQGQDLAGQDPQQVKETILSDLEQARSQLQNQFEARRTEQRLGLLKDGIKWSLGALVSGVLFGYLWYLTAWARQREQVQSKKRRKNAW